jgi:hypothetical protein
VHIRHGHSAAKTVTIFVLVEKRYSEE